MQLVSRKNFLITLAAVMVVAMGIMALSLIQKRKAPKSDFDKQIEQVQTQSESTDIESLEKDLSQRNLKKFIS